MTTFLASWWLSDPCYTSEARRGVHRESLHILAHLCQLTLTDPTCCGSSASTIFSIEGASRVEQAVADSQPHALQRGPAAAAIRPLALSMPHLRCSRYLGLCLPAGAQTQSRP